MTAVATAPTWFAEALECFRVGDIPGWMAMYADDAVHEFPFSPDGYPDRLEGKAAIDAYMQGIPALARFQSFDDLRVRELPGELIIEADGHGTLIGGGGSFDPQYVWFISHTEGRVHRFREYINPLRLPSA